MHPYSVENRKTHKITFMIGLVTVGGYLGLGNIIQDLSIPQWFELPSIFLIFYLLFQFWNRILWRAPFIRKFTNTEYIGGTWEGKGVSSYKDEKSEPVEFDINVDIAQTWSSIEILFQTNGSHSVSNSAYFNEKSSILKELVYTYRNNPNYDSEDTMSIHEGTCKLRFDSEDKINGEYYTDPQRESSGTFTLEKKENQSLQILANIRNFLRI